MYILGEARNCALLMHIMCLILCVRFYFIFILTSNVFKDVCHCKYFCSFAFIIAAD